eukprot:TRINITY_DN3252_c0_g1_i1.p1 TRINITY_DN3252_c0_g1~~TRINITY_DN3252_c0_g1_i1.p1  ORF type:complete len:284 (+),score=59.78 TRINITY_DN3252_c0_g1_i1:159-1010(+)
MKRNLMFTAICLASLLINACGEEYTPLVIIHGLLDSGSNLKDISDDIKTHYPGIYIATPDVDDGWKSYSNSLDVQITHYISWIQRDDNLNNKKFNLFGISQGGIIARGIAMRMSNRVHNVVSFCGPQEGVSDCKGFYCSMFKMEGDPYTRNNAVSCYWRDPKRGQQEYETKNPFLPLLNNDVMTSKSQMQYDNFIKINKYVLVKALNDTVVIPKESTHHEFFSWGEHPKLIKMREMPGYQRDAFGLKTLDSRGDLVRLSFEGDHIRPKDKGFLKSKIYPFFDN